MLVVLEGCDRTGKTTLAQELARQLPGAELRHCERPTRHPLEEYEDELADYVPGSGQHVIYDRHCWGERVWPTIYDRPTEYTDEMHAHVELFLESRGATMVYCTAREDTIIERLAGEPYPPPEQVGPALELFLQVRATSRLPSFFYDFQRFTMRAPGIIRLGMEREVEVTGAPTQHWIGAAPAELLLVGDRPNGEPGFAPFRAARSTSGEYLLGTVRNLRHLAITNALDVDDAPVPLADLWRFLQTPRVVALGREASAALREAEVPHGVAPHPQWARRFKHAEVRPYLERILHAAQTGRDVLGEDSW